MRNKFIAILLFLVVGYANAQLFPLSDKSRVSVLTCGTGNEIYSLFGHTAIRITDPITKIDIVYNYGAFDFATPNFVAKFTKGDLQYFVTTDTFTNFINQYQYEQRSVFEQELNLPLEKKQALFDNLNQVLLSDARFYTYKFIDRNCTNMAVDIINETLGSKIIYKTKATDVSYRQTLYPYFDNHFYEQIGTSIIFGKKVDEQATLLFLPYELLESLKTVVYRNRPLAAEVVTLLNFPPTKSAGSLWNNIYTYLIFLVAVVLINKKPLTAFYLVLLGLIGVFFSIAGWYSLHRELEYNYNILLFNPLYLVLLYFYYRNNTKWISLLAIAIIIMLTIAVLIVVFKVYFWIVVPIIITNAIVLLRILRQSRSRNLLTAVE